MKTHRDDRDLIFRRIREALAVKRDDLPDYGDAGRYRELLPEAGGTLEEQIALFRAWSGRLNTEFITCSQADWENQLRQLAAKYQWKRAAFHGAGLSRHAVSLLGIDTPLDTGVPYCPESLEACDVAFTECAALIAQTGSVLLTSRACGGRAASVLPPHHVVLATAGQMVPDLPAAMALIRETCGDDLPSLIAFHTGPSRTGDIERTIVLGAHGPKILTVILIDSDSNYS